ncbi:polynucleotide 5'-hydroxyl-kinase GRC3/NOL9 [Kushneria sinocarnis]|uniref:Polynucleotide 5'-hydroxyl-kinase GRC3/NOL9 n=1 Tax=Kushneria sinocarnis TaxID=595502 RepID=A0A420WZI7_9GAMM|nr:Clp1/GlmU family protein [Kushneria sinocarnis]RKR06690.1 polynucleotide 5'-hydroxyl-kinase GRC3/NOL9 [Kushneria sinocarnis]
MRPDETGIDLPAAWERAIAHILGHGGGRVVVLGAVDTGKSTFCRALMAAAARAGCTHELVDTDPGQKMVGPPATLTRSRLDAPDCLARLAFVGTPSAAEALKGVRRALPGLLKHNRASLTVVNTSGLLGGRGRALKASVIDAVHPQLIVALGDDPALDAILQGHARFPVLRLAASPHARRRGRGERRRARIEAFRRYLATAETRELTLGRLRVAGHQTLSRRQLVGLIDRRREEAMGVVEGVTKTGRARVLTPASAGDIGLIRPGALWLSEAFEERREPPGDDPASGPGSRP